MRKDLGGMVIGILLSQWYHTLHCIVCVQVYRYCTSSSIDLLDYAPYDPVSLFSLFNLCMFNVLLYDLLIRSGTLDRETAKKYRSSNGGKLANWLCHMLLLDPSWL